MISAIQSSGYAGQQATAAIGVNELGRDQFLMLLLAQLRNQDPLKPMEDREFITQLAQFNVLEQMQQMNQGLMAMMYMDQFTQASALVGKTVEARDPTTGDIVSGQVTEVYFDRGVAELLLDGKRIGLENVTKVS
ncbi:MAG: flagellar hook capping FlgD N-terminal domain-containing protein [Chloroflexota bacterium]